MRALKVKEAARTRRRRERKFKREDDARATYEARWKALLVPDAACPPSPAPRRSLHLCDVPWPVFSGAEIGPETIAAFLVPEGADKKEKLRQTLLRFHPDKFEGRIMPRIRASDKELVRDAVGRVARAINDLLAGK